MRGTVLNLINTVTGAGILALPLAMKNMGLVLGVILLWLVNLATDRTIQLLLYSIDANDAKSFASLSSSLYGHKFKIIVDLNTFLLNFGICTSYVVIIGTLLSDFAEYAYGGDVFTSRAQILLTIAPLVFLPLSCLKRLDALRYVSFVALTFLVLFVVIIVMIAFGLGNTHVQHEKEGEHVELFGNKVLKMFESLPVIFFAFVCQMNIPSLYNELRRMSPHTLSSPRPVSKYVSKANKMAWAVRAAFFVCCTLYTASAVAGYTLFLDDTKGNILDNFETGLGGLFKISPYIKLIYGALLCVSYPTMSYSGVRSLHRLLFEVRMSILPAPCRKFMFGHDDDEEEETDSEKLLHPRLAVRTIEAAVIVGFSTLIGVTCEQVTTVFSLTGAVCCSAIMYIFPGCFYYKTAARQGHFGWSGTKLGLLFAIGGAVFGVLCTTVIIYNIATGN